MKFSTITRHGSVELTITLSLEKPEDLTEDEVFERYLNRFVCASSPHILGVAKNISEATMVLVQDIAEGK